MKKARKEGMSFILGSWDEKKFRGKAYIVLLKKTQVLLRCPLLFQKLRQVWLRVNYDKKKSLYNEGVYDNFKDLKQALSQFTEQNLVNDIKNY